MICCYHFRVYWYYIIIIYNIIPIIKYNPSTKWDTCKVKNIEWIIEIDIIIIYIYLGGGKIDVWK